MGIKCEKKSGLFDENILQSMSMCHLHNTDLFKPPHKPFPTPYIYLLNALLLFISWFFGSKHYLVHLIKM